MRVTGMGGDDSCENGRGMRVTVVDSQREWVGTRVVGMEGDESYGNGAGMEGYILISTSNLFTFKQAKIRKER